MDNYDISNYQNKDFEAAQFEESRTEQADSELPPSRLPLKRKKMKETLEMNLIPLKERKGTTNVKPMTFKEHKETLGKKIKHGKR